METTDSRYSFFGIVFLGILTMHIYVCAETNEKTNGLTFERLSLEHGLSQSSIPCMTQDSKGFMWFGTMNGLNRFDGHKFDVYLHDPEDQNSLSNDMVYALLLDENNNLWIGTSDGVNRLSLGQNDVIGILPNRFTRYYHNPSDTTSLGHNRISSIFQDSAGFLWFGTPVGLSRLDANTGRFTRYYWEEEQISLRQWLILRIGESKTGNIFAVTAEGETYAVQAQSRTLRRSAAIDSAYARFWSRTSFKLWQFKASWKEKSGILWVATTKGLYRYNPESDRIDIFQHDPQDPNSLSTSSLFSIFSDRTGILWIGTELGGINRLRTDAKKFNKYTPEPLDTNSLRRNAVYSFCEDPGGFVWVGTRDGIVIFNPMQRKIVQIDYQKSILARFQNDLVSAMAMDLNNKLWIGVHGGGPSYVDFSKVRNMSSSSDWENQLRENILYNEQVITQYAVRDRLHNLNLNRISNLHVDSTGRLWIATLDNGIGVLDFANDKVKHYLHDPAQQNSLSSNRIRVIYEDKAGVIWVGTDGTGLDRYEPEIEGFAHYTRNPNRPSSSLSFNVITSIYEDDDLNLWLGTYGGGMNRLDPRGEEFEHFNLAQGLPNNVVYGILPDDSSHIWISSNGGISKFDLQTRLFENYDMSDGLQSNEFNSGAFFKSMLTKRLYWGGINGFNEFHPDSIKSNEYIPPIVITSMQVREQAVRPEAFLGNLLELEHDRNSVAFAFVALDYSNPTKCQYAYMIEGLDEKWIYGGNRRYASYYNLPPGQYKIRVKGSNSDGVWNEDGATINLSILPPWWLTWWFRISLLLATLTFLWISYQMKIRRIRAREVELRTLVAQRTDDLRRRSEELVEQKEIAEQGRKTIEGQARKLRQMDKIKSRFFANISHEFRTPLTLILGPVEQMLANGLHAGNRQRLVGVRRNALRLLTLINQLLDLSKLESGKLALELSPGSLNVVLDDIASSFAGLAEQRQIDFSYEPLGQECNILLDRDKIEKVLNNLLSNAFKFTPSNGRITLTVRNRMIDSKRENIEITVKDTGAGIEESELGVIFDRFYGSSEKTDQTGSGIGLALVKELVTLHGGRIDVKSRVGKGTEFVVSLDFDTAGNRHLSGSQNRVSDAWSPEQYDNQHQPINGARRKQLEARQLLVFVEDNNEVQAYVQEGLQEEYQIISASDGVEGLKKIKKYVPDIVVSDIMMPEQDGVDLCKSVKNNENTSHIPVILLTAKASLDSKLDGLQGGADDYMTKPFNLEELKARMANLIKQRQKLQAKYGRTIRLEPDKIEVESLEEAFLKRICEIVNENLSEFGFGPSELAHYASMTERQLRRKINALTKKTPRDFIRIMRLRRAQQLLTDGAGNITEVAYQAGFGNISYFSKCFRQEFGHLPSEVQRRPNGHKGVEF